MAPPTAFASRWIRIVMLAAVPVVFVLALFDLRREQGLAMADFTAEQAALARVAAIALEARLALGKSPRDLTSAGADLGRTMDAIGDATAAKAASPQIRMLVVDERHRFIELGGDQSKAPRDTGDATLDGELRAFFQTIEAGSGGTVRLSRSAAESLGLDRRTAVAGFAPLSLPDGRRWSLAVVTSAMRARDRARLDIWRLAASTGLTGLLVGLFALVVVRQERRAQRLAEALRLSTETAQLRERTVRAEKLATIGTLAAGVAHEVGTPLGIISGRAEQLLSRVPPGEEGEPMQKGLSSIMAQVDKVSTTIRQLLDFARVRPIETVAISPAQAIGTAAALLDHRFDRAGVRLSVEAETRVPALAADPGQLEQVLVNLLMNACDACVPGGQVIVRARALGERVEIAVTDDGSGIAPEHLPHVLDPFFTTKKRGHGTGLGLSIAADIVKNHGGTLEIDSVLGRGTTVRVRFPVGPIAVAWHATKEEDA